MRMHAWSTISVYDSHLKAFIDKFLFSHFLLPLIFCTTINMTDALSLFTIHIYWNYMFIHAWFFFSSQYWSYQRFSMPGMKWNLFRCICFIQIYLHFYVKIRRRKIEEKVKWILGSFTNEITNYVHVEHMRNLYQCDVWCRSNELTSISYRKKDGKKNERI